MSLVAVGAASAAEMEAAIQAFEGAGFRTSAELADPGATDVLVALHSGAPELLLEADGKGVKYQLVHVGPDDRVAGGTFQRAHHRVEAEALPALAHKLKTRSRMLISVLAFGYKHGLPAEADWVIDARFLKNPYWVEELRSLDGRDKRVSAYVLGQPAAAELIRTLTALFIGIVPDYGEQGRMELTIAFGCTGGRHRSVALAAALAKQLRKAVNADVVPRFREL